VLDLLAGDAHGARVLRVLTDPAADARRSGRRAPRIDGPIPGAAVTADTLVELASGRVPARVDVVADGPPRETADELRRRVRGQLQVNERHGAVDVRAPDTEAQPFHVRLVPRPGTVADGPFADPVLRLRGARLHLDGALDDPDGDLAARRVRLTAPDALERHPEAVLHLARLAVRPGFELDAGAHEAAVALRRAGAPANTPLSHLGFPLADLLASPELPEALAWLEELAPERPLAEGVVVDAEALRRAAAIRGDERTDALLRALAPGVSPHTLESFKAGTHL
jgi:hypothetical protein